MQRLEKQFVEYNQHVLQSKQEIKALVDEKVMLTKKAEDLEQAAKVIVDMVDPVEGEVSERRILLERLQRAPQRITNFVSEATKTYVAHVLSLVKSFWPKADLSCIAMTADCSERKFNDYLTEVGPFAQKILEDFELE